MSSDHEPMEDVRLAFHNSMKSEEKLSFFLENNAFPDNGVTDAYKGLSKAMMAQYTYFPFTKYEFFQQGKGMVEKAIKLDPANPELRYVRLLLQLNTPSFLGYRSDIDNDLAVLMEALDKGLFDKKWKATFVANLIESKSLTLDQRSSLCEHLAG
ncbi:MAG: hypothetical protein RIC15_12250 [Vicingaceae bacterium]